jgi:rhodanese-related sulfurtransferase
MTIRPPRAFLLIMLLSVAASRAFQTAFVSRTARPIALTTRFMASKAGISSPEELKAFVAEAGDRLLVVDVRNPDAVAEPGDQKSLVVSGLPSESYRTKAVSLVWDRETNSMPLPDAPKDTPVITHCGGGGRGQKAKDFLLENGFSNVLNGAGPKETDCWAEYGEK